MLAPARAALATGLSELAADRGDTEMRRRFREMADQMAGGTDVRHVAELAT